MSATQFAQFFVGLTEAGYSTKLFRQPMTHVVHCRAFRRRPESAGLKRLSCENRN